MATEYPPLSKIHVVGYSANNKDYPILNQLLDPRVAGYKVPEDFSACPDKRYPNHIFTGAQPISGDQRVRHTWEILPSPWVPFTRYDDDLGPVQGRRRSVKNEGQQASLKSSTKISYEGREGSSLVLIESEETWSIKTDNDGNSLFPVKIRDFYDPSRGAVEERRQLFVPTGEEVASLENVNGIITQTSYEPYNEYLSYKVVQTYAVDGPQLIGNSTDNDGQLVTVTTQRKASDGYVPPDPTATTTVEVSREDAESLIERVVETPELFDKKTISVEKPDVIPEKFRASINNETTSEVKEGDSVTTPTLGDGEFQKTAQRESVHTIRETTVKRDPVYSTDELSGVEYEESFDVGVPFVERIATSIESGISADINPLGDGKYLVREYDKNEIETSLDSFYESYPTRTNLNLPRILKSIYLRWDTTQTIGYQESDQYVNGQFTSVTFADNGRNNSNLSITPQFDLEYEDINGSNIQSSTHLFFIKSPVTLEKILTKCGATATWPVFKTKSYNLTTKSVRLAGLTEASYSYRVDAEPSGNIGTVNQEFSKTRDITNITLNIPPCIHKLIIPSGESLSKTLEIPATSLQVKLDAKYADRVVVFTPSDSLKETVTVNIKLNPTTPDDIPRDDIYLVDSNVEPYKYGFFLVTAVTVDASQFA